MKQHVGAVTLIVRDYDAAIAFYTRKLGFALVEDADLGDGKRWVCVAPPGSAETRILLAEADGVRQQERIGDQTGGRVSFFLHTDDFWRDHGRMTNAGVVFREDPRQEPYGTVAVFEDLYGNAWDLLQPK